MLTVKDYLKYKASTTQEMQIRCDKWLEDVVFPHFTENGWGVECPDFGNPQEVAKMLEQRGWSVTTLHNALGSYLYLSIPPQGE